VAVGPVKERRKREFTVAREAIEWFPAVDGDKCRGCQTCVDFCFKKVFIFDRDKQKAVVADPFRCVVLCSGCQPKCPHGAIAFPRREDFEQFVRYLPKD
jgi:NAD-dependent dihydropyrimidine dehydrogenase PreA subunit